MESGLYHFRKSDVTKYKWDRGYLVVDAEYAHSPEPVEEYIDLVPILEDLYIDPADYLSRIREVVVGEG